MSLNINDFSTKKEELPIKNRKRKHSATNVTKTSTLFDFKEQSFVAKGFKNDNKTRTDKNGQNSTTNENARNEVEQEFTFSDDSFDELLIENPTLFDQSQDSQACNSLFTHLKDRKSSLMITSDSADLTEIFDELQTDILQSPVKVKSTEIVQTQLAVRKKLFSPQKQCIAKAPIHNYNRYRVVQVNVTDKAVLLDLCSNDLSTATCSLEGFWRNTVLQVGDIVNIISHFNVNKHAVIDDQNGFIIVTPDHLLSGTTVVGSLFCQRKSVLSDLFPMCGFGSKAMLTGSILHSIFEDTVLKGDYSEVNVRHLITNMFHSYLRDIYALSADGNEFFEGLMEYIPGICGFKKNIPTTIAKIIDSEQSIWSPKFGIKGKIDLVVENSAGMTIPLEVKTGRATVSPEHRGQVMLYSLLMSQKGSKCSIGLLLYLKNTQMNPVDFHEREIRGLIQMRNDLARYATKTLRKQPTSGVETYSFGCLPEPLNSARFCKNCEYLTICSLYQRDVERWNPFDGHVMLDLVGETLKHLTVEDVHFFLHWAMLVLIENRSHKSALSPENIWMCTAEKREKSGLAIADLMVINCERSPDVNIVSFRKNACQSIPSTSISRGDAVVISSNDGVDLCLGFAKVIQLDDMKVVVTSDTDFGRLTHNAYRIDKWESAIGFNTCQSNLCQLVDNSEHSARLRRLIIHHEQPKFETQLSKSILQKLRGLFRPLNRSQKTVLMKVLLSKDYVIVKGYPGTGKSSAIVAMVRMLNALGKSVLLTGYTHSSVDNLLLKLKKFDLKCLRLGQLNRIHPELLQYAEAKLVDNCKTLEDLDTFYKSAEVVACTCLSNNHAIFARRKFDVCIVDEASQVLLPVCLGQLFNAERFVLVGDPKQLPPIVKHSDAKELGYDLSLIEHLDKPGATYELTLQYRMNECILRMSNELVYEGKLKCAGDSVGKATLEAVDASTSKLPVSWNIFSHELSESVVFLNTADLCQCPHDSKLQTMNKVEATIVHNIVMEIVKFLPSIDIGVIAPYRNQVKLLKEKLRDHSLVEVNTVDQYQGRDKSVIIISFVRCQPWSGGSGDGADILEDVRRLNVALTRAKLKLVLIGNVKVLKEIGTVGRLIDILKDNQFASVQNQDVHISF